ncbi:MAG: hypothetical protein EZS28_023213 [Streblomastix strix]|uniref:Uncharacterized protein n=1 Tax=Streblomastix strix TaxID=222440 RepID=A0A5J4VFB5_9EUKA|nr:MAG: hypothetical protein EZS28_023213 [Streblomastix strix]
MWTEYYMRIPIVKSVYSGQFRKSYPWGMLQGQTSYSQMVRRLTTFLDFGCHILILPQGVYKQVLNRHKEKREIVNRRTFEDITEAMMVAETQDAFKAGHPYEPCTFTKWVRDTYNKDIQ